VNTDETSKPSAAAAAPSPEATARSRILDMTVYEFDGVDGIDEDRAAGAFKISLP
jgi:hypothetical protein